MSVFSLTTAIDLIPFPSAQDKVWKSPEIKQASTFYYKNPPFSQSNNLPSERSVPELHLYAHQAISSFASEPGQASPSVFLDGLSQRLGVSLPKFDNPSDLVAALKNSLPDWRLQSKSSKSAGRSPSSSFLVVYPLIPLSGCSIRRLLVHSMYFPTKTQRHAVIAPSIAIRL